MMMRVERVARANDHGELGMRRARGLALVVPIAAALAFGCRPAAPTTPAPPPSSSPRAGTTGTPGTSPQATAPPAADLPDTCTIELELLVPSAATGHGTSEKSSAEAKEAAWADACAQLRKTADLDCNDAERVGIVSQRSSSLRSTKSTGVVHERYELDVELGTRRTAKGFGDAPGDRQEACRRAKARACEQLVAGPCPETGVRVIAVDGKPPSAAAVEPAPTAPRPRDTI
jgi:hypothetical protein